MAVGVESCPSYFPGERSEVKPCSLQVGSLYCQRVSDCATFSPFQKLRSASETILIRIPVPSSKLSLLWFLNTRAERRHSHFAFLFLSERNIFSGGHLLTLCHGWGFLPHKDSV